MNTSLGLYYKQQTTNIYFIITDYIDMDKHEIFVSWAKIKVSHIITDTITVDNKTVFKKILSQITWTWINNMKFVFHEQR